MFERARDYGESTLASMGLQTRLTAADYVLPALGLFGVGMLVGVGLGLIIAPKRGTELRGDIGRGVRRVGAKLRRHHDPLDVSGDAHDGDLVDAEVDPSAGS